MARALRIEYPGACYHVMCRGNQRRDIFQSQEDVDLFVRCLGEICLRNGVIVHAWCLMSNHYHLLLEMPFGNLVDSMKWFQGTFTQRYNADHKLCGHLFQGRYKAKVIDDSDPAYFRIVSEYIHLNPVEAGSVKLGQLAAYPWSSYPLYLKPLSKRPQWLCVQRVLAACGLPDDSLKSRHAYEAYMNMRQQARLLPLGEELEELEELEWRHMERGWMHGGHAFRRKMIDHLQQSGLVDLNHLTDGEQKRDLSEEAARQVLARCLQYFGVTEKDLLLMKKSDPRKMLIAGLLRYHYPVSALWVSDQLKMGHYTTISRAMRFYREPEGQWGFEKQQIHKFIDCPLCIDACAPADKKH